MGIDRIVKLLNSKSYLRFFASVQLAVPLLLLLGAIVAVGTVIESRYNTDYARILVYDAPWFRVLLILLWINIFLSTLSRYPFKVRHIGFVTVHVGLLALLVGGLLTGAYGVDGQLRVIEGGKSSLVSLSELSLQLIDVEADSAIQVGFNRGPSHLTGSSLDFINDHFNSKIIAREYLPFAEVREAFESRENGGEQGPVALGFMLKSQFFNVNEWLISSDRPEIKMGPATVRLVMDESSASPPARRPKLARKSPPGKKTASSPHKMAALAGRLVAKDSASGQVLTELPLSRLHSGLKIGPYILNSVKAYKRAVVVDNRLAEGNQGAVNPALELIMKAGEKTVREVVYAKYPDFSLSQMKGQPIAVKFTYTPETAADGDNGSSEEVDRSSVSASDGGGHEAAAQAGNLARAGNVIEFHVPPEGQQGGVRVELYKDNQKVMEKPLAEGESVVTPWMGIRLTLGSVKHNAVARTEVAPAGVEPHADLPPGAIYVTPAGAPPDQGFWLAEGQFQRIAIMGREYEVYFGRKTINLPFSIQLVEFRKTDYPGTETAMSYESLIKVNGQDPARIISMNEPLTSDGYTLYQSSFEMRPGQAKASIFSVNRDPGRGLKYLGSLILGLGIIIFTLMRSRVSGKKAAHSLGSESTR